MSKNNIVYKPRSIGASTTINNPNYIIGVDIAEVNSEVNVYKVIDDMKYIKINKKGENK